MTAGNTGKSAAVVGTRIIKSKHINYRLNTEKAYGNSGATNAVALISLVNEAVEHEVARANGVTISQQEMSEFRERVDKNSKAPEILAKVKAVFGEDVDSYERIHLAPRLMNRNLRYYFSRDAEIHKKERLLIEAALRAVLSGKSLKSTAEGYLKMVSFEVEDKSSEFPQALQKYAPHGPTPKSPLLSILQGMKEGEIYKNIVEDDFGYKVIRLIGKEGNKYSCEAITVKKRFYEEWFKDQAARMRIEITDGALKKKIMDNYRNIWWVKGLTTPLSVTNKKN